MRTFSKALIHHRFTTLVGKTLAVLGFLACAMTDVHAAVDEETLFVFNTFSFLVWGALVMWMCAGFTMLDGTAKSQRLPRWLW